MRFSNIKNTPQQLITLFQKYANVSSTDDCNYKVEIEKNNLDSVEFNISRFNKVFPNQEEISVMHVTARQNNDCIEGEISQILGMDFLGGSSADLLCGMDWENVNEFDSSSLNNANIEWD